MLALQTSWGLLKGRADEDCDGEEEEETSNIAEERREKDGKEVKSGLLMQADASLQVHVKNVEVPPTLV